ncbi:transcriptional regulator, LacI family [Beutenbergia cavernae DSM 12333]|uniref:Transcriptional regulator, LacI family n=1 Tax=Beutenbergia cavernae (strain ATCC BAA-8 / DSM 12333 / CCUG 43141 / JCM 11478 / NBRC 16432 / NCIMB 13614 / HKI 0122) TaxID=471853 RepID=C5BW87_BEUC1|nr:LacI family DNA-binding transcriptional regulator [Beutenbergia cavernae]ACQ78545.1 transcriptional regulator, LacI family [Beutenbergia cavernae DSM 12333]
MAVTRADVAAMAGVSPALVSYVINGGPRPVSDQARRRVEAAIEALGYRPNAIASALRGGMTRSIGLLTPSPVNPFFAEMAEALVLELFQRGNTLSIGITDDDPARETLYLRSFLDRRVDGLIVTSSRAMTSLQRLHADPVPAVVIDRVDDLGVAGGPSSVHVDNLHAATYAVEHLQAHGHRVIGCIAGPWPVALSAERIAGWRAQQERIGADASDALVEHAEFSESGGREAALALLGPEARRRSARASGPTALFVASDVQAFGAIVACAELGLRVPDDVAIVSLDGTATARFSRPPLTSVRQPVVDMVRAAVGHLLDHIADPELAPAHTVLRGNLVVGRSCGCGER